MILCPLNILEIVKLTTIALTRTEIGSDLQYTEKGKKWKGGPKVFLCPAHEGTYPHSDFFLGLCGKATEMLEIAAFFRNPDIVKVPKRVSGVSGVVLTMTGKIFTFDSPSVWIEVVEPFHAIGSGEGYAIGALASGASVKEAIQIASKKDPYTGLGVKVFSIK